MFIFNPGRRAWQLAYAIPLFGFSVFSYALTFEQALNLAASQAPEIRAQSAKMFSAKALVQSAGQLPDPKLEVGIENLPIGGPDQYSLDQNDMTMRKIGVMQEFPNAGKRKAEVDAANADARIASMQLQITTLDALKGAASAWIERDAVEHELGLISAFRQANDLLGKAVHAKILSGKAPLSDGLIPRQESVTIDNLESALLSRRLSAIAELERWIGNAAQEPLQGDVPEWPINQTVLSQALPDHPQLMMFDYKNQKLDAEVNAAKADKTPDWGVEMAYQQRAPQFGDMISVQFTFALPVFPQSRQDPRIAARIADKEALDDEHEAVSREQKALLASDIAEYQRLQSTLKRQNDILLPLVDEKVGLILADWQAGKASLAALASARLERMQTELQTIEIKSKLDLVAVRLHFATMPGAMP